LNSAARNWEKKVVGADSVNAVFDQYIRDLPGSFEVWTENMQVPFQPNLSFCDTYFHIKRDSSHAHSFIPIQARGNSGKRSLWHPLELHNSRFSRASKKQICKKESRAREDPLFSHFYIALQIIELLRVEAAILTFESFAFSSTLGHQKSGDSPLNEEQIFIYKCWTIFFPPEWSRLLTMLFPPVNGCSRGLEDARGLEHARRLGQQFT
jgi:hypothetical protein